MSIVSNYIRPEAQAALQRQRRGATLSAFLIAFLLVTLVGLILAFTLLPGLRFGKETLVIYQAEKPKEQVEDRPEIVPQVQRKPAAPSSSMSRVIASSTPSPVAVPIPEVDVPDPEVDFGNGDDFGDGWGSGDGLGAGGGGTTFFGQSVKAERIAYVIDYSKSMRSGGREDLMREELTKSIKQMAISTHFGMIFFAGPAWVAGDEVHMEKGNKAATVRSKGGHSYKWKSKGGASNWEHDGRKEPVVWLEASKGQIAKSVKVIDETNLVWGTRWDNPLAMALAMDPPPQIVYFMTDGVASGSTAWAKDIGEKAKAKGIKINCIAMMQPRAHDDMDDLAKRTGGQFTIVMQDGKRKKVR